MICGNINFNKGTLINPHLKEPDRRIVPEGVYHCEIAVGRGQGEDLKNQLKQKGIELYRDFQFENFSPLWRDEADIVTCEEKTIFTLSITNYRNRHGSIIDHQPELIGPDNHLTEIEPTHGSLSNIHANLVYSNVLGKNRLLLAPGAVQIIETAYLSSIIPAGSKYGFSATKNLENLNYAQKTG